MLLTCSSAKNSLCLWFFFVVLPFISASLAGQEVTTTADQWFAGGCRWWVWGYLEFLWILGNFHRGAKRPRKKLQHTLPKFNSSPLKMDHPNRKGSSSNHHFSGAMFNFGGVVSWVIMTCDCFSTQIRGRIWDDLPWNVFQPWHDMIWYLVWPPPYLQWPPGWHYIFSRGFLLTLTFHCYSEGAISKIWYDIW